MWCACFIRTPHATPIPAREGGFSVPCGRRNTIVRCLPGRPGDAIYLPAYEQHSFRDGMGIGTDGEGRGEENMVGGMDVCFNFVPENREKQAQKRFPPARGVGEDLFRYIEDN